MVKRSPFLDIKPKTNTVRKAKTGTTATVTDVLGAGRVEVQFGDDPENLATGRATGGVTAIGAEVAVEIDPVTGKLTSVGDPITIPEDAELVSTGITGETLLTTRETVGIVQTDLTDLSADHSRLDELTEEIEEAQAALDADMEDLAADLAEANEMIDDAGELIETVVKPGLEAAQGDANNALELGEQNRQDILAQVERLDSIEAAAEAAQSTADTAKDDAASAQTAATDARSAADAAQTAADAADGKATAAQSSADAAQNLASSAQSRADSAQSKADAAQTAADAAGTAASQAQVTATGAQSSADAAQSKADSAASAAAAAQSTADTAKSDAASAAGIAGGKGDVLIQSATPAASMRKATTLWIDTTGGANTPKRWNGSAWVAVTDKAATDAASAAATAQSTADQGVQDAAAAKAAANSAAAAASGAQATADAAAAKASTADGRLTVSSTNPTASDAAGKPIGAIWEVRSGGTVLRRYCLTAATTWTQIKIGQDFIGDKAIGTAQIGDAAIGTAQIGDLQVTNGKIGDLSVDKLKVIGNAQMPTAVIDNLMAQNAFLENLLAQRVVVGGGPNKVDSTLIEDGAITTPKINATEELWAKILAVAGDATIGGNLIGLNTIAAPNIVASKELSALIGKFLEVSTDQLTAGDAKITGDLLAENISGVNLYGVTVDGGEFWIRGVDTADVVVLHETFETGTPANGVFNGWRFVNSNGNAIVVRAADGISGNCVRASYSGAGGAADPVLYFTPTAAQQAATVLGEVTVTVPMRYSGGMQQIAAAASVKFTNGKAGKIALRVSKTVDGWDYWVCTVPHGAMLTEIRFTCVSSTAGGQSVWLDEVTVIKNNTTDASMHLYRDQLGEPLIDITSLAGTKTTLSGTGFKSGATEITWEELVAPNIIVFDGIAYPLTGRFNVNINCDTRAGALYAGSTQLSMPYTPPDGYYWQITGAAAGGLGWIGRIEGLSSRTPTVYGVCHIKDTRRFFIGWRLSSIYA